MLNLFLVVAGEQSDADGRERMEEALRPPNRINPATGLPYAWGTEDDELDGLDDLLTG